MRNTNQFPVTAEEAIAAIQEAQRKLDDPAKIGSIRPYALRLVERFIEINQERFEEFSRTR